jgi:hypothetical protein
MATWGGKGRKFRFNPWCKMENIWKKYWNVFTKTQLFDSYDTVFFENRLLLGLLYDTEKFT